MGVPAPANAATGDALVLGQANRAGNGSTTLAASGTGPTFGAGSDGTAGSALLGQITNQANGTPAVYGITSGVGNGVTGYQGNANNEAVGVRGTNVGKGPGMFGDDGSVGSGSGVVGFVANPNNPSPAVLGESKGAGAGVAGDDDAVGTALPFRQGSTIL